MYWKLHSPEPTTPLLIEDTNPDHDSPTITITITITITRGRYWLPTRNFTSYALTLPLPITLPLLLLLLHVIIIIPMSALQRPHTVQPCYFYFRPIPSLHLAPFVPWVVPQWGSLLFRSSWKCWRSSEEALKKLCDLDLLSADFNIFPALFNRTC